MSILYVKNIFPMYLLTFFFFERMYFIKCCREKNEIVAKLKVEKDERM